MVTEVEVATGLVVTVKVALVAPAGTVTPLTGTLADGSPLERETTAPPLGAGPLSVTVPVEGLPPATFAGLKVSEDRTGIGCGVTVSVAVCVPPPYDAEMVTEVEVTTGLVVTVNVALVAPAGTVTPLAGTLAAALLLDRETRAPPLGAGPFRVTVPVGEEIPPVTLAGLRLREEGTGGTTVSVAVCVPP